MERVLVEGEEMKKFEVKEEFLLEGKPIKIMSGAIHYFRIQQQAWEHSLYNLKALGFNTVETYIPWNIHETKEGKFDFSGIKDIVSFIKLAQEMELLVIVRPSPYICAEWEYGGLPAWLLNSKEIKIRTNTKAFLEKVENYYKVLMPLLTPLQITEGGPIIMMQIENEYGSFGNDKNYIRNIKKIMQAEGVNVPLFTSDGTRLQAMESGSLTEDDILPTGNFGSNTDENFDMLEKFIKDKNKKYPLMSMEFWDGWFNRWGEEIIKRDENELANEVKKVLQRGSINLYMFHGGTNFGFYNGCSARLNKDLPQVTSYDYDALLTEAGDPTPKYFAVQNVVKELFPEIEIKDPRYKKTKAYGKIKISQKTALFSNLQNLSKKIESLFPKTMERVGNGVGYILYRTNILGFNKQEKIRLIETSDRASIYVDEKFIATKYDNEFEEELEIYLADGYNQMDILVENMGRVNYGHKLYASSQSKGIRSGLMVDIHYHANFENYALDLENIEKLDFTQAYKKDTPAFYLFEFEADEVADTFLDTGSFGKGVAFINNFNLGRYWNRGPIVYLYIPKELIKKGKNKIIIFETENVIIEEINLMDKPKYLDLNHLQVGQL